jgi:hypothetical protein
MRRECKSAELLDAVLVSDSGNAAVCKYEQLEGTNVCLDLLYGQFVCNRTCNPQFDQM